MACLLYGTLVRSLHRMSSLEVKVGLKSSLHSLCLEIGAALTRGREAFLQFHQCNSNFPTFPPSQKGVMGPGGSSPLGLHLPEQGEAGSLGKVFRGIGDHLLQLQPLSPAQSVEEASSVVTECF